MSDISYLPQEWPGAHYYETEEIEAAVRVLKARSPFRYYGLDPQFETARLEADFARFIGLPHCLAVASGTTALQVALGALGCGPGDEVIIPGYFWVSTVGAVVRCGAVPVLADSDATFGIDPDDLRRKISPRTKAVILVYMGGVMGQVEKIVEICRQNDLLLLEDCAQAAGASLHGRMAGSFGDMSIFSFQINKNITGGEGGAVLTANRRLYEKARAMHDTGYLKATDGQFVVDDPENQFWGIGCRMSDITAAVVRAQLSKLPEITGAMRTMKYELRAILEQYREPVLRRVPDPQGDCGGFLMVTLPDHAMAWDFKQALIDNGMVVDRYGSYPIHMEEWGLHMYFNVSSLVNKTPVWGRYSVWDLEENRFARDYRYHRGTLPVLDDLVARTVLTCVPSRLSEAQKDQLRRSISGACTQLRFTKR